MPRPRRTRHLQQDETVRLGKRHWPVLGRIRIRRRTYLLLEQLSSRGRWRALDMSAAPGGELRMILSVPSTESARQYVRVLKRLSGENINLPQLLDYHEQGGKLRLVTTWVRGEDLQSYLARFRPPAKRAISPYEAIRLIRGLAHGLSQLLRFHGLVHGDIKPANLIVARRPSRLVMIDYGAAWHLPHTTRRLDGDGLSPGYAAPELHGSVQVADARCDQFAASVVAFEMLTGRLPYDGLGGQAGRPEYHSSTPLELVAPSKLTANRQSLPRSHWQAIDEVVCRGLQLDPDDRYPTAGAWTDALDRLHAMLQPNGPAAAPHGARLHRRLRRWIRARLQRDQRKNW